MPYSPTPWFYLGPLGRLVALPAPEPGIDASIVKHAAQHVSLNAHTTEDVQGYRREWTISMPYLERDDVSYLEACYLGAVAGPLRLVDPTRRNRLSAAASATTVTPTWRRGTESWATDSGAFIVDTDAGWPTISSDTADGRALAYRADDTIRWALSGAGSLTLDALDGVPVLPGETVTASAYVRTDGPAVTLDIVPRSAAGDLAAVAGSSATGDGWQRVTATYSAAQDVRAIVPRLSTTDVGGTIHVAAAQVESGAQANGWTLGTGCPPVLVTEMPARSPLYPLVSAELSLREI